MLFAFSVILPVGMLFAFSVILPVGMLLVLTTQGY